MSTNVHIHKLAELSRKADSPAMHRILECAMTEDEARCILDLPAPLAELAEKWGMDEGAVENKLLGFAKRGLILRFGESFAFPQQPAILHDNILASAPKHIPPEMGDLWMEMYDGEGWANEIGDGLAQLPLVALRAIPALGSITEGTKLRRFEDIEGIIEFNKDLIVVRNCCCRTGAKKCGHPLDVCIQFGERAEYDIFRGSGKKISVDEAMAAANKASQSGLVPMVSNLSDLNSMEFICFCCGCCCLVLDTAARVDAMDQVFGASRFMCEVENEKCDGCGKCEKRCVFDAITMEEVEGFEDTKAIINTEKCLGCGACVPGCPIDDTMTMKIIRPPEFVPETYGGPSILHML